VIRATIVDWSALGQTVIAAFLAGVGVAFSFSLGILGAARLTDSSQDLGVLGSFAYGVLAVLGFLVTAAAIAFGIIVMTSG
jgi:hypothetical protein